MNRLLNIPLAALLAAALLVPSAVRATIPLYQNDAVVNYPVNVSQPPAIDAVNFLNNGTFIINFTTFSAVQPFYQTSSTLGYTNIGWMACNSGFQFDNRSAATGNRTPSFSFYNAGTIACGSAADPNAVRYDGSPQCVVAATNIAVPGDIVAGSGGRIQLSGQNIDLRRTRLSIEGNGAQGTRGNIGGTGNFGLNTNYWNPSAQLGDNSAVSAPFFIPPYVLSLNNSKAYYATNLINRTNWVVRTVFIQNDSATNVSYNVYFDAQTFGLGGATIEWVGGYQDIATGQTATNYLYLVNDYLLSASTNLTAGANGIPANFSIYQSTTPQAGALTPEPVAYAGFIDDWFIRGAVTNMYSFADGRLIATSVDTNSLQNHSVTNLPGRVEISADKFLDMSLAELAGMNYLSIRATNQFNGTAGALIEAPYSDFNVGVTNGAMTFSNAIASAIPVWGGTIQAWSTSWTVPITGGAVDYRVLIVRSNVKPTSAAQVQDVVIHSTNSLVVSDTLNIMRTFSTDAQNVTLTTNGVGNGATSIAGEVNVQSADVFWGTSAPNIRNLTNNGAIRFQNLARFAGLSNSVTPVPASPAVAAYGLLSGVNLNSNVVQYNKVIIGTNSYTFVKSLTNSVPNLVKIGTKFGGSMSNLIAAINHGSGAGSTYSSATKTNLMVTAGTYSNGSFTVTARVAGTSGNNILTTNSATATNLTWNGWRTLHGGANAVAASTNINSTPVPYHNFINSGLVSDQGSTIWATNFVSCGAISNGLGSFALDAVGAVFTNGWLVAAGDVSIYASSIQASNVGIRAGRSLTLSGTNWLTDNGLASSNVWVVGGGSGVGLNAIRKPANGDLLGTVITAYAPTNRDVVNTWAGIDYGASPLGYTNNIAVGRLTLVGQGTTPRVGQFTFAAAGATNAIYVDCLDLQGTAGIRDSSGNVVSLSINPNMTVYFAQALIDGVSVAQKLDQKNGGRLRWVPEYAGNFSSVALVYPDGSTNVFNAALAASSDMDSNGNGIPNVADPSPFFVPSQINPVLTFSNGIARLQWSTIPLATNSVSYSTNASGPWMDMTNFTNYYYGSGQSGTNANHSNKFISPQPYPGAPSSVWIYFPAPAESQYYRIAVEPWLTYPD